MHHLDDGTLRRILDEPLAVASNAQDHYERCADCQERGRRMREDAGVAAGALAWGASAVAPSEAYARFAERVSADRGARAAANPVERVLDFYRWNGRRYIAPVAAVLAAAAVVLLFTFTPVGTLAQNFLTIFEPQQFVAVNISKGQLEYLPDLEAFGTIVQHGEPAHRAAASAAQASALTGVPVRLPSYVPPSVPRTMRIEAGARDYASFTFSAAKARAYAAQARRPMPPMPPGLDGSRLTLQVGPMVVVVYGKAPAVTRRDAHTKVSRDDAELGDLPPLVVVESAAPRVSSTGATAREIQSYLLGMPGVPPELAAEIRAIGDPSTTMPIPVPIDKAYSQDVIVDGAKGLAVGDNTGVGGMIVWQENGIVYGVGGALPQRELMEVAESLR